MTVEAKHLQILKEAQARRAPVFFASGGVDILFESRILELRGRDIVVDNTVRPEYITRVAASDHFALRVHMIQFLSEKISSDGVSIIFPLENAKVIEETRQSERVTISPSESAMVEMINPFDGETVLVKSLMEMSTGGMSIRTPADSQLFQPGILFRDMKIVVDGKVKMKTSGRVVYQRKFLNRLGKRYCQVGFRFEGGI